MKNFEVLTPSTISRSDVLGILMRALQQCAYVDYGLKYTENEEDMRASIFRYVRNELDAYPEWRVFLSYSITKNSHTYKPDLVFTTWEGTNDCTAMVEIIFEMKNWQNENAMIHDLDKLCKIRSELPDRPDMVYFACVGNQSSAKKFEEAYDQFITSDDVDSDNKDHLFVRVFEHREFYRGPWDNKHGNDPWRKAMRSNG